MALDFLKQHTPELEKAFTARPARDPMPARRQKVIDGIDRALSQLKAGELAPKRGWYQGKEGADGVRVQLKSGNKALVISGRDNWFVPDATKFFNDARKAVQAGELDDAIQQSTEARKSSSGNVRAPSSTRSEAMREAWKRRKAAK